MEENRIETDSHTDGHGRLKLKWKNFAYIKYYIIPLKPIKICIGERGQVEVFNNKIMTGCAR